MIQRQYLNPCNSLAFKLEILINKILGIENQSVNYMSQENGVHICFNSLIISYISLYVLWSAFLKYLLGYKISDKLCMYILVDILSVSANVCQNSGEWQWNKHKLDILTRFCVSLLQMRNLPYIHLNWQRR